MGKAEQEEQEEEVFVEVRRHGQDRKAFILMRQMLGVIAHQQRHMQQVEILKSQPPIKTYHMNSR